MHQSGFTAVGAHMSDLIAGRASLDQFKGVIAVDGFSYGDVLGAGDGWSKTILFNANTDILICLANSFIPWAPVAFA
jgi:phosphoribosylformylglycinamidine synthase